MFLFLLDKIRHEMSPQVKFSNLFLSSSSFRDVLFLGPRDIREMLTKTGISLRESDAAQRDLFKKGFLTITILTFLFVFAFIN